MILEQELGIVAMEPMGEYDNTIKYEKLNIVTYKGSSYCALGDTLGNDPTNEKYWQLIAKEGDKGDTYELTEEDKENIKNDITENANSDFNKNVESKTNTFNDNVIEKTSSFNTNVENKTKEFNDNSTTKLEEFNTNSTNKLEEYNTNATTKINSYNTNATAKLEEYNTNANVRLNEYNSNADGLMTIAKDTRNELERVKNDILETGEASGNYLTLNDSAMAELQELEVNSVEKQVTTTGYNKLGLKNLTRTSNGVTLTIEDGVITLNGTNNGTESIFELSGEKIISSNTHKIKSFVFGGSATNTNGYLFYMYSEGWKDLVNVGLNSSQIKECKDVTYSIFVLGVKAGTFNNHKVGLLVGDNITEETPYEPYTGLNPSPSPDYPQEIPMITTESVLKSVGKNLLNFNNYVTSTPANSWIETYTSGNPFKEAGTYSFSCTGDIGSSYRLWTWSKSGSVVNNVGNNQSFEVTEEQINNIIGVKVVIQGITAGTTYAGNIYPMIKKGDKPTEYEPYQETILNIPIPEGEFIGYINDNAKDQFRVGYNEEDGNYHLYLDKMLSKVILNGSENITSNPNGTNSYNIDIGKLYKRVSNLVTLVCSHFKAVCYNDRSVGGDNICFLDNNSSTYQLTFRNTSFTTIDDFKTWLSENNVLVVYELVEPYTLDLGIVDMPLTYDGVTNIFVDTDFLMNINAKYYRNFTETIRNLQINNDTLKNELASIESRLSALEVAKASVVNESEVVE